jgi:hypothetical protein
MTDVSVAERISLARELVDDLELSRLPPEALLLKASRLARFIGDEVTQQWLAMEIGGYSFEDVDAATKAADRVWRWSDKSKKQGWWSSLAELDARINALQVELHQCRIPDVSVTLSSANPNEYVTGFGGSHVQSVNRPVKEVLAWMETTTTEIQRLTGIRSRVLAKVHEFVFGVFYELAFSSTAGSIFGAFQSDVDTRLAAIAGEAASRLPAVSERLATGDQEAISHAMTTCRRIIDSFSLTLYPPSDAPVTIDSVELQVGPANVLNRLNAYIAAHSSSSSRRERLRKNLRELYARVSTGVHSDVTSDEAHALYVQTYVTLGEISLL